MLLRNTIHRNLPSIRHLILLRRVHSDDLTNRLRNKGLAEENQYFRREQEIQIKKLRDQLKRLESNQEKLASQLQQANELLKQLKLTATEDDDSDDEKGGYYKPTEIEMFFENV